MEIRGVECRYEINFFEGRISSAGIYTLDDDYCCFALSGKDIEYDDTGYVRHVLDRAAKAGAIKHQVSFVIRKIDFNGGNSTPYKAHIFSTKGDEKDFSDISENVWISLAGEDRAHIFRGDEKDYIVDEIFRFDAISEMLKTIFLGILAITILGLIVIQVVYFIFELDWLRYVLWAVLSIVIIFGLREFLSEGRSVVLAKLRALKS